MNVTAVVVTYNSAATIRRCLLSLWAADISDIIVVDNNSRDTTRRQLAALGVPCLALSSNRGFAAACNIGAAWARTPLLLFINPDAVLEPPAVARVVRLLARQPAVGAVGCGVCDNNGTPEAGATGRDVSLRELALRHLRPAAPAASSSAPVTVDWVSAAAIFIRRDAFQAISGFDDDFFMYWEDVDLCRRLRGRGWTIALEPRARALHQRGASLKNSTHRTRLYDAAADTYFRKHYPAPVWRIQHLARRIWRRISPQAH